MNIDGGLGILPWIGTWNSNKRGVKMLEIIKSIFLPFEEVHKKAPDNQFPEVFRLKSN